MTTELSPQQLTAQLKSCEDMAKENREINNWSLAKIYYGHCAYLANELLLQEKCDPEGVISKRERNADYNAMRYQERQHD